MNKENETEKSLREHTPVDDELEVRDNIENELNPEEQTDGQDELSKYKEMLLRSKAEFENYKKRTNTEISNYIKYASESLLKELLPVYDDLSRSIESIKKGETKDFDTLKTGMEMIHDKFKKVLEEEGVQEIDSLGKPYNVETSTAIMQVDDDSVEPNTIVQVVEKGYKLKDKIIRHEKVVVSK